VPTTDYPDIQSIRETFSKQRQSVTEAINARGQDTSAQKLLFDLQSRCDNSIANNDITKILVFFSTKELFERLKYEAAITNKDHAVRVIVEEKLCEKIPELTSLRTKLRGLFAV
jgi:hypothetical protein